MEETETIYTLHKYMNFRAFSLSGKAKKSLFVSFDNI